MLQITEYNLSLKLGLKKSTAFNYDWKGQACNQLGTPSGTKSFLRGTQIF